MCLNRIKFLKLSDDAFDKHVVEEDADDTLPLSMAIFMLFFVLASMEARAAISNVIICLCLLRLDDRMDELWRCR